MSDDNIEVDFSEGNTANISELRMTRVWIAPSK